MLNKRGDVTPYIVVGLVLVIITFVSIYFIQSQEDIKRESEIGKVTQLSSKVLQIDPYIKSCIKKTTFDAVLSLAFLEESKSAKRSAEFIPEYIEEHLYDCIDWSVFQEFEVDAKDYRINITNTAQSFIVDLYWPINIRSEGVSLGLENFELEFPLALDEIFSKIENVQKSQLSLDLEKIFDQEIDIFLEGCEGNNLIYAIDDEKYQLEGSVITFFFDSPLGNLTNLFSLDDNLKYRVPVKEGKHILRRQGSNKKLIFDTDKEGIIEGCYKRDNETNQYTFTLIENNKAIVSATGKDASKIDIIKEKNSYTVSNSNKTFTLTFYIGDNSFDLIKEDKEDGGIEETVESIDIGEYIIAEGQSSGKFTLKEKECKSIGSGNYFITFASLNYIQSDFNRDVNEIIAQIKSKEPFNGSLRFQHTFSNNSCDSFDCEAQVRKDASQCENNNVLIGLVNNPKLGTEHKTIEDISYISSYLAQNEDYCISCGILYEIGKQLGLEDSDKGLMSLNNASLKIEIEDLDFSEQEKEIIRNKIKK